MRFSICFVIFFFLLSGCGTSTDVEKIHDEQLVKIHLQFGFVDELNTFEGTFTKDLVEDGSITVEFWLPKEDQESIIELAQELSFNSLPDTIPALPGVLITPNPSPDSLRIKFEDMDKTVVWSYPNDSENTDYKKVIELSEHIMSIVKESETYKLLPEARGGRV
jgi:hypothetical protein